MPVEIKELVIRAVVAPGGARPPPAARAPLGDGERAELVEAVAREVLRVLRASKER